MKFKNVTLIGGGVLGSQIAYQTAFKGFNVTTYARTEASIGRAQPKVDRLHETYVTELKTAKENGTPLSRGLVPAEGPDNINYDALIAQADQAYESFRYDTDLASAVKDADLVIEALAENFDQKVEFYGKMRDLLPEKTIVVTNSSTLLPSKLADATGRPEQFMALHFANSIWKNNTAEVMGHSGTSKETYDSVAQFAEEIGMIPIKLKKEKSRYVLNTMLIPFLDAAQELLVDGIADVETIDKTWTLSTGAPLGPFRILDIVGIKTAYDIAIASPDIDDPTSLMARTAKMLKEEYLDKGKNGVSTGEGFYKY